jgi:hypothetical protein
MRKGGRRPPSTCLLLGVCPHEEGLGRDGDMIFNPAGIGANLIRLRLTFLLREQVFKCSE